MEMKRFVCDISIAKYQTVLIIIFRQQSGKSICNSLYWHMTTILLGVEIISYSLDVRPTIPHSTEGERKLLMIEILTLV